MLRNVLVVHDLHPHIFALRHHLNILLGEEGYATLTTGTLNAPATASDMVRAIVASQDRNVLWCEAGQPLRGPIGDIRFRSLVPVAHPIAQTLHRYRNWAQAAGYVVASTESDETAPRIDTVRFVSDVIDKQQILYPLANFHLGILAGGKCDVDPDSAVPAAETLLAESRALLADFPHASLPIAFTEILNTGAVPREAVSLSFETANLLLEQLREWQETFPADLFAQLCAINVPDLLFYDTIARGFVARAPLTDRQRATILNTVDAAAEITGHRLKSGTAIRIPPQSNRTGLAASFVEADPTLGWRLRPNGARPLTILGRDLVMNTGPEGSRPVAGQPSVGQKTVAIYGCSTIYGWSIAAEETCCSVLQSLLPDWRIENYGVPGYGQTQNLIQLERNSRWETADFVTFGWIGDHLRRNIADVSHLKQIQYSIPHDSPVEVYPRASLDPSGLLVVNPIPAKRPELLTLNVADFETDVYYRELICFHLFRRAHEIVTGNGGHFFVTSLWEVPSPLMRNWLAEAAIPWLNASVHGEEYQSLPDDGHANAKAHRIYAERMYEYITQQNTTDRDRPNQ